MCNPPRATSRRRGRENRPDSPKVEGAVEMEKRRNARRLTMKQLRVLEKVAAGYDSREGAESLGIAQETYRTHVQRIHTTLKAHTNAEAVANAYRLGILPK